MKTKNILLFLASFITISCSSQKNERRVVNDFLNEQFTKNTFLPYIHKPNILVKEAGNGIGALLLYEQTYGNSSQINYKYQNWIIDSLDIKRLKKLYQNRKDYNWTNQDFDTNFIIINSKTISENFKSESYLNLSDEFLVLRISKPLFINKKFALIWFGATDKFGSTVERVTVLMKRTDTKWSIESYYYDPDSSW